jgi:hypothetical protein
VVAQIVVSPGAISDLVRLGWLDDSDRGDRQAVRSVEPWGGGVAVWGQRPN